MPPSSSRGMVKVAIHQPNYMPWIGFFQKMALADVFVILDTVQFSKDSYTQRTKIRTKDGWTWLTIPVERKYHFKPINELHLPQDDKWLRKHKMGIIANYAKAPFFDKDFVDLLYSRNINFTKLQEFNEFGICYLKDKFGIRTELVRASELEIDTNLKSTELLIEILKKVGGDFYISGMGGIGYMDGREIAKEGVETGYFKFEPFEYPQRWEGFMSYISAIDLLFNTGTRFSENQFQNLKRFCIFHPD